MGLTHEASRVAFSALINSTIKYVNKEKDNIQYTFGKILFNFSLIISPTIHYFSKQIELLLLNYIIKL